MPDLPGDFNLSIGLALSLPAQIEVHCDRMVAPKGGRFRSRTGNRGLNMLFYEIQLGYFFFARNFNKSLIQSL
jgi:hypothetical protein